MSGMDKVVAFDQSQSLDDLMPLSDANRAGTSCENNVVTLAGNNRKKPNDFNAKCGFMVRSEGLEPPRFYSLPPQGSASTNSATSAWDTSWSDAARRIDGADVTNQGMRDKEVLRPDNYLTSGDFGSICLTSTAI